MFKKNNKIISFLLLFSIIFSLPIMSLANENLEDNIEIIEIENYNNDELDNIDNGLNTLSDKEKDPEEPSKPTEPKPERPKTKTPFVRKPTTTVYQMKQWAISKNAEQIFIDLAKTFYDVSVSRGIDPAVVYAQSAKETNFMKFTGVLDATYFNPCGMKNTAGGGDYEKEAHKRFKSWNEGILAQVDHLALYAGMSGYPKYSEYMKEHLGDDYDANGAFRRNGTTSDPRHFSSIYGKANTIELLGGNWAPSLTYGGDILLMLKELAKFPYSSVVRYAGIDRYETASKINKAASINSNTAVISSGNSYPDTITASILAGQLNANLYINNPSTITQELNSAIQSGKIKKAYIVGGNPISSVIRKNMINKGIEIENVLGPNRFDTSASVAELADDNSKVFLANGLSFPDSLSIAPVALKDNYSLVLTDGKNLTNKVKSILNDADEVVIVGGTNSVSSNIGDSLRKSGVKVSRIFGDNRYETSIKIANTYYRDADFVLTASGENYADALTGTILANRLSAPVLLNNGKSLNNSYINYLKSTKIDTLYILGGSSSVSSEVGDKIKSILDI